jgi:hypothetical protein
VPLRLDAPGTVSEGGTTSDEALRVDLPVANDACAAAYGAGSITSEMVCAGYPSGGRDSCQYAAMMHTPHPQACVHMHII